MAIVRCAWCAAPAEFFLLSDRDSHNSVDHACAQHTRTYAHLYRRSVLMPTATVDLRDQVDADVRADTVPAARISEEQTDRTGSAY